MANQDLTDVSTDTLRLWLENNRKLLGEFDPHIERAQLHLLRIHMVNIGVELLSRSEKQEAPT